MKIWTQKQRERGDKRVTRFTAEVGQRAVRLEKAQATLADAQERVTRHEAKLELEQSDLAIAVADRKLMERKCHCCGTGFRKTDTIFAVIGADGETQIADRCPSCQAISLVLHPESAESVEPSPEPSPE